MDKYISPTLREKIISTIITAILAAMVAFFQSLAVSASGSSIPAGNPEVAGALGIVFRTVHYSLKYG